MKYFKYLLLCLALLPISIKASEKSYEAKNLEETLKEEQIEYDLSNYKESDDQITIYMFRGNGCGYCKSFLNFLNSISSEYGKYFKLRSYEVWYNKDNNKLFKKVANFLEEDAGGVPYIIIGDQIFPGYASQYDDAIKQAIIDLYNSTNRYDVMEEMQKAEDEANKANNVTSTSSILWSLAFAAVGTGTVILYDYNKTKKLNEKIDSLEKNIKELKKASKKDEQNTNKKNTKK